MSSFLDHSACVPVALDGSVDRSLQPQERSQRTWDTMQASRVMLRACGESRDGFFHLSEAGNRVISREQQGSRRY